MYTEEQSDGACAMAKFEKRPPITTKSRSKASKQLRYAEQIARARSPCTPRQAHSTQPVQMGASMRRAAGGREMIGRQHMRCLELLLAC